MRPVSAVRALACVATVLLAAATARGGPAALPPQPAEIPWPTASWPAGPAEGGDSGALERAADSLFEARGRGGLPDTRALLVVQGGRVVLERYADGFGRDSRFRSW